VVEFAQYFGSETKLDNWKRLCEDLNLEGEFTSITICRNVSHRPIVHDPTIQFSPASASLSLNSILVGTETGLGQYLGLPGRHTSRH
jgi:hypothetical protein